MVAVVLGGSWARGAATPSSDVDLGIYYHRDTPPDVPELRRLAREVTGPGAPTPEVTEIGGWGPWVNGGAWLTADGVKMDWVYREIEKVERVIQDCCAGVVSCDYYLGHPHGFHNQIYAGEVHYGRPLSDPQGAFARLVALTVPYPAALREALVRRYLYDARFMLALAKGPAGRADVFHVAGCLFRCTAALVQVLLALNERYFTNEKGAIQTIDGLPRHPASFASRIAALHAAPGATAPDLHRSLGEMESLIAETAGLAAAPR